MDNLEEEKTKLFQLIESWKKENILLALQIVKRNKALKSAVKERYLPIIKHRLKGRNLNSLVEMSQPIFEYKRNQPPWTPSATTIEVLKTMPIEKMYFSILPEFPDWICELSQIQSIYIKNSTFKSIPKSIENLTQLKKLHVKNCALESLPESIENLTELTELDFSKNKLNCLPQWIGNLSNLKTLNWKSNQLTALPKSIGNLTNLEHLNLDFNKITKLPESIGNLENLQFLCLESNKIQVLPKSIIKLEKLRWLSIEKTPLGRQHNITKGTYVRDLKIKKIFHDIENKL